MMGRHAAMQGGDELGARRFDPLAGQVGQSFRIALAGDQGLKDGAAADAEDVREAGGQLNVRVLQGFLDAQGVLGDLTDKLFAGTGEVTQLLDRLRGDEAAPDEAVGQQVGDPSGIADVALAAGDVADVHGVGEDELEVATEHMPDRLPVHAARLHGDVGAAVGREPVAEGQQVLRGGPECADLVVDRRAVDDTRACDHGLLVHVQTGALGMNDVHNHLPGEMAAAWSPRQRSLEGALSGFSPVAAVRGARGAPGPTPIRALRTNAGPTSVPTPRRDSTSFHATRVRATGGQLQ